MNKYYGQAPQTSIRSIFRNQVHVNYYKHGMKDIAKRKRLSDAVVGSPPWTIASTDSSNMDDANQSLLLEIFKYQKNPVQKFYPCNKALRL